MDRIKQAACVRGRCHDKWIKWGFKIYRVMPSQWDYTLLDDDSPTVLMESTSASLHHTLSSLTNEQISRQDRQE